MDRGSIIDAQLEFAEQQEIRKAKEEVSNKLVFGHFPPEKVDRDETYYGWPHIYQFLNDGI